MDEALRTPGGEEPFGSDVVTPYGDALFRAKKKHKVVEVSAPDPALEAPVADTHIHLAMLRDPALSLARAAVHGIGFLCCISNPTSDSDVVYSQVDGWFLKAQERMERIAPGVSALLPRYRLACGCHPHDARLYDADAERKLVESCKDPRTCCVGEIGLDYHYDHSPRNVQRDVFRRQLAVAHETGLPVALHLREAHDDGLAIMDEEGFPAAGTILHCFNLGVDALTPWVERGCHVAVGGAVTFGSSDDLRAALPHIPRDRFLFETDGPFMAPAPFRSCECGPELTIFTAAYIADSLGYAPGPERERFLSDVFANTLNLLDREETPWQSAS